MTGRWVGPDGQGEIIVTFDQDWSFFATEYRSDTEPEKWYKDSWHGAVKPKGKETFDSKGIKLDCN